MKQASAVGTAPLAQLTEFERFLIINKQRLILASFLAGLLIPLLIFGPAHPSGMRMAKQSARMQTARQIGLCLYAYSVDHNGKYPTGKSSTDIFQQLIDQNYVNDPAVFYFSMPGKTPATTNKLKPENVCFDITNGVQSDDPDTLPVVSSTGYKIDYVPGGKAHLLANGDPGGVAVFFKGNNAAFLRVAPDGIPLFPPVYYPTAPPFDPKGRTYQQLTPDGPIP
jgi:hypothetical protein